MVSQFGAFGALSDKWRCLLLPLGALIVAVGVAVLPAMPSGANDNAAFIRSLGHRARSLDLSISIPNHPTKTARDWPRPGVDPQNKHSSAQK